MPVNRHLLSWSRNIHVYLSVALLLALVFFSITGITLNHPDLSGEPLTSTRTLDTLPELPRDADGNIASSPELERFLRQEFSVRLEHAVLSYEDEFLIIDYQVPGAATLIEIDGAFNEATVEHIDYGLIAALNDLHKGRHTDVFWKFLIDLSGVVLVIFALAGFVLLFPNKRRFRQVMLYSGIGIALVTLAVILT